MLKLMIYPAAMGTYSTSPFCVKAALLLQHSGLAWEREDVADPRKMPHGKLPVLQTSDGLVHDSGLIRNWLLARGAEFDAGLTNAELAIAHAMTRMAEEHMYFVLLLDRWGNDEIWPIIRDTYFLSIPPVLRSLITGRLRKTVLRGMLVQGLGRMSVHERLERVEHDFAAILAQLGDKPFLFGDAPTSADFSVVPVLEGMRATPRTTDLSRRVGDDPLLCAYIDRMAQAVPLP